MAIPAAPTGLAATAVSSTQVDLTWIDNSTNESGFKLERATAAAGPFTQIAVTGTGVTGYSDSGLTASTTYYYRVRATNAAGDSAYSSTASATTQAQATAPAAPTGLAATAASSSGITLFWADNSSNETGFKVERATASAGPFTQIAVTGASVTGYSDSGLAASTTYYYRVRATNAAGDSTYSNTASATTQAQSGVPAAPTGLTATAVSSTSINLAWTDNSTNETGFKIERATVSTGPWSQRATTGANNTAYSDTGLTASTTYYYRVSAAGASGYSATSNVASVTTQATSSDTIKPTVPTGLIVTAPACGVLTVSWTASTDTGGSGLRGYKIYRSGSYYTQTLQPASGGTVSITDSGLREALFYSYEISAIDNAGNESAKCPIGGTYSLSCAGQGGEYTWAKRAGGAYLPDSGSAIAVDAGRQRLRHRPVPGHRRLRSRTGHERRLLRHLRRQVRRRRHEPLGQAVRRPV